MYIISDVKHTSYRTANSQVYFIGRKWYNTRVNQPKNSRRDVSSIRRREQVYQGDYAVPHFIYSSRDNQTLPQLVASSAMGVAL